MGCQRLMRLPPFTSSPLTLLSLTCPLSFSTSNCTLYIPFHSLFPLFHFLPILYLLSYLLIHLFYCFYIHSFFSYLSCFLITHFVYCHVCCFIDLFVYLFIHIFINFRLCISHSISTFSLLLSVYSYIHLFINFCLFVCLVVASKI